MVRKGEMTLARESVCVSEIIRVTIDLSFFGAEDPGTLDVVFSFFLVSFVLG